MVCVRSGASAVRATRWYLGDAPRCVGGSGVARQRHTPMWGRSVGKPHVFPADSGASDGGMLPSMDGAARILLYFLVVAVIIVILFKYLLPILFG